MTYAELSVMSPGVGADHQRVIVRRSQDHKPTEYAQIDFQRTLLGCSPLSEHRESAIPDGCSEVTLETPLVNSVEHKSYNQEVLYR